MPGATRPNPLLLGATIGVGIAGALGILRVQPAARDLMNAKERARGLSATIASAPPITDPTALQDEVDALRDERDALAAANEARAARVAPDAEVPDLEHRVAALAREAGLRLESQAAGDATTPRARRWTFGGTFHGLWTFIAGLDALPRRVVLRDLQVRTRDPGPAGPLVRRTAEPPLEIQVTVIP